MVYTDFQVLDNKKSTKDEIRDIKTDIKNIALNISRNKKDTDSMIRLVNANIVKRLDELEEDLKASYIIQNCVNRVIRVGLYLESFSVLLSFLLVFLMHISFNSGSVDLVTIAILFSINTIKTLYIYYILYKKRYSIDELLSED
jgi:hypothetical protein